MARKIPENIETWVAEAVGEATPIMGEGMDPVRASFEGNAGDYQHVKVEAENLDIPLNERFSVTVDDRTIQFMALEFRGGGEYLLRVRID